MDKTLLPSLFSLLSSLSSLLSPLSSILSSLFSLLSPPFPLLSSLFSLLSSLFSPLSSLVSPLSFVLSLLSSLVSLLSSLFSSVYPAARRLSHSELGSTAPLSRRCSALRRLEPESLPDREICIKTKGLYYWDAKIKKSRHLEFDLPYNTFAHF